MIILDEKHRVKINRNSSKGNQLKWKKEEAWYKVDFLKTDEVLITLPRLFC